MRGGDDAEALAPPPPWAVALAIAVAAGAPPLATWVSRTVEDPWHPFSAFLAGVAVLNGLYVLVFAVWLVSRPARLHLPTLAVGWDDIVRMLILTLGAFTGAVVILGAAAAVGVQPSGIGMPVLQRTTEVTVWLWAIRFAIAPIAEEVLYRGALLGGLRARLGAWAIGVQAVLFGLAHLRSLSPPDVGTAISAAAVGAILGWGVYRWRRLAPAIGAHALVNML